MQMQYKNVHLKVFCSLDNNIKKNRINTKIIFITLWEKFKFIKKGFLHSLKENNQYN